MQYAFKQFKDHIDSGIDKNFRTLDTITKSNMLRYIILSVRTRIQWHESQMGFGTFEDYVNDNEDIKLLLGG